jgi:hypothetical protein
VIMDPAQAGRVSVSAPSLEIRWRADEAVSSGDRITLDLSTGGVLIAAYDYSPAGTKGKAVFAREQLRQLVPGTSGWLRVCIARNPSLGEVPPRGGYATVSYCSAPKSVEIVQ